MHSNENRKASYLFSIPLFYCPVLGSFGGKISLFIINKHQLGIPKHVSTEPVHDVREPKKLNSRVDKQKNELGRWKPRIVAIYFCCFWLFDMSWSRNKLASLRILKYGALKWPHRVIRGQKLEVLENVI